MTPGPRLLPPPKRGLFERLRNRLFPARLTPDVLKHVLRLESMLRDQERRIARLQESVGRVEARQLGRAFNGRLEEREFRVFSQWGEDGIIAHLCDTVALPCTRFVEFGVESYDEANTRFLLVDRNWSGLVMDGDAEHVERIRRSREYWLHDLTAVATFVTRENVDELLREHGYAGELGLLSIDVDGMDYWIWEGLRAARPAIVVIEYNFRFGPEAAVTVPYDPAFDRRRAHPSLVYYGASLAALHDLGRRKGYDLVGCGSAGLNAFFVRRELRPPELPALSAAEAWREGRFGEVHDAAGRRVKMSAEEQARLLRSLPLVDVGGRAP